MVKPEANSSKRAGRTSLRWPDSEAPSAPQWIRHVNGVEAEAELKALRYSLARGTPFGDTQGQKKTAAMLGLEFSLRPRGRPKQQEK